jgi:biopolymer transport protein ExbB
MLGLFGTVQGMILAFKDLSEGVGGVDAASLAKNIQLALGTTFLGLMVAMPGLFLYSFFRSRVVLYSLEVGGFCEQFLRLLRRTYGADLAKSAAALPPPGAPTAGKGTPAGQAAPAAHVLPETGQPPLITPLPPQNPE